jgi:hypothetical protein
MPGTSAGSVGNARSLLNDVVDRQGIAPHPFGQRKAERPLVVHGAIDQLRTDDMAGPPEIEVEIVGFAEVFEGGGEALPALGLVLIRP